VLRDPEGVRLHAREEPLTGVLALPRVENHARPPEGFPEQDAFWGDPGHHAMTGLDWVPAFRTTPAPETPLFAPANVADGHARPYGTGHSWRSTAFEVADGGDGARATDPEWVELAWSDARTLSTVQFACDTSLTEWFNVYGDEARAVPESVRDYRIEVRRDGAWETVVRETGNVQRFRRHSFDPVTTDRLRVVVEATNGVPWAELFEVRAYGPEHEYPLPER
jgi:hypothetical protein